MTRIQAIAFTHLLPEYIPLVLIIYFGVGTDCIERSTRNIFMLYWNNTRRDSNSSLSSYSWFAIPLWQTYRLDEYSKYDRDLLRLVFCEVNYDRWDKTVARRNVSLRIKHKFETTNLNVRNIIPTKKILTRSRVNDLLYFNIIPYYRFFFIWVSEIYKNTGYIKTIFLPSSRDIYVWT